ncbi:exonuclease VIII [Gemmata sp. SH-PL17]|uniref:PD-(D/E)XK nuclease-like domain-containing protein n=1 Tax=Gemmata sp. SH-PL17 TaxID=1630693 RepID=UPI00078B18F9|nr:PD-(D/E)XK nuclease-like domain-containing protein [Gemmata sp. SH-PL17]AMV24550.1 exonuclease VIII [Gemmata sp. SH-PL17]
MNPPCIVDMTAAEYHRDPCPSPSLSASIAKVLLNESPLHAWLKHPKFGGLRGEATEEMDSGTIVHEMLLGKGPVVEVLHFKDYRTDAAKAARDAARAEGLIPVLVHKYESLAAIARDLVTEIQLAGFDLAGFRTEAPVFWYEETGLGPVLCRGMMDAVRIQAGAILDLKNTCADPKKFAKKAIDFGYDIQFAAYTSALRKLNPEIAGREDFVWLLAEELPEGAPKRVALTVARPDGTLREHGRSRWKRACELWAKCLQTGHWPAYATEPVQIEAPVWALKEELGTE